jgi:hypothetical protein
MATRRSAALARAEKALVGAKKRAAVMRQKIKKDQPMEIALTIGGGAAHGYVLANTPQFLLDLSAEIDPGFILGGALVGYGLLSTKDGQLEKASTSLGTGMLAAAASQYVQNQA